jgi:hypothetical protein
MKLLCPDSACSSRTSGPLSRPFVRKGRYFRKSDGQWIPRFHCSECGKYFSSGTQLPCYRQKKRKINHKLFLLLNSGVSQRRAAILLGVSRRTVAKKVIFLAEQSRVKHAKWLKTLEKSPLRYVQFDDLETSEHSKCKPLSVTLAVDPQSRKILGFQVSQMPAKGHLARTARAKYGPRTDERPEGWDQFFASLKPIVSPHAKWLSDQNPHYPRHLLGRHPEALHSCVKGQRGCIAGQGELKKLGFDPLFALNHTCAMLRANLNRLFRRTWCTTKKRQGLIDHLSLYVIFHNQRLTPPRAAW